jgi:hypothetical protein
MDDQGNCTQKQQNVYKSVLPLFSPHREEELTIRSLEAINEGIEEDDKSTKPESDLGQSSSSPSRSRKDEPTPNSTNKKGKIKRKQSIMGTIG